MISEHFLFENFGCPVVDAAGVAEYRNAPCGGRKIAHPACPVSERKQAVAEHHLHDDDKQHGQNGALRLFEKCGDKQPHCHDADIGQDHGGDGAKVSRSRIGIGKVNKSERTAI